MLKAAVAAAGVAIAASALLADFSGSYVVPLDHAAIQYATAPQQNRVAELQQRIRSGQTTLRYTPEHGYLEALLDELHIPASSQVLVFSKTSFQAPKIAPRTPRALYHSDDVYIGYVRGGDVLEIAAEDANLGVVFYTLEQEKSAKPSLDRRDDCLQCHAGAATIGVPGIMVRSMHVERSGMPIFNAQAFVIDHRSPIEDRWGGWYVTGKHGSQLHMGNVVVEDKEHPEQLDRKSGANVVDLQSRVDTTPYLRPGSDIASLMVLEHKTRMTNLITRVGFEARMALKDQVPLNQMDGLAETNIRETTQRRINNAAEELVRYMLFIDEAPLQAPIEGSDTFAKDFAAAGPRDSKGRSLRDLDLQRRVLRYPCSFLIYSAAFDALPAPARDRIYRRLFDILSGQDQTPLSAKLSAGDRKAILDILRETKQGLPAYWTAEATASR